MHAHYKGMLSQKDACWAANFKNVSIRKAPVTTCTAQLCVGIAHSLERVQAMAGIGQCWAASVASWSFPEAIVPSGH